MKRAVLILISVAACVRPGSLSITPAVEEKLDASFRLTHASALQALSDQGLPLRIADAARGVIETDYFDIVTYRADASAYPRSERLVRLRVIVAADSVTRGSTLAIQAIYSPFSTGTGRAVTRRDERATPRDHPANVLARQIARDTKKIAEGRG